MRANRNSMQGEPFEAWGEPFEAWGVRVNSAATNVDSEVRKYDRGWAWERTEITRRRRWRGYYTCFMSLSFVSRSPLSCMSHGAVCFATSSLSVSLLLPRSAGLPSLSKLLSAGASQSVSDIACMLLVQFRL